jgi:ketosteroid isomerase-like protein
VEIVRAASEAINRGDVDAALKHWPPDCEFDVSRAVGPVHGTYYGLDQIRQALEEFYEPWESGRSGMGPSRTSASTKSASKPSKPSGCE